MTNLNNHEKIRINCRKTIYDVELTVASTIVLLELEASIIVSSEVSDIDLISGPIQTVINLKKSK